MDDQPRDRGGRFSEKSGSAPDPGVLGGSTGGDAGADDADLIVDLSDFVADRDTLADARLHQSPHVRRAAVENPASDPMDFVADPSPLVRLSVASRVDLDADVRASLFKDPQVVRLAELVGLSQTR